MDIESPMEASVSNALEARDQANLDKVLKDREEVAVAGQYRDELDKKQKLLDDIKSKENELFEGACSFLTILSQFANSDARANGWWDNPRDIGALLMLMVTELAEAYEAHRNNDAMDDHLTDVPGLHAELGDTIIRVLDYCGENNIPIGDIVMRKMKYNRSRGYRHGGKQA